MIYASLCDGIGAVHAAWQPLGWTCAWTSEIEPFPCAVVEHHWHLPNLGDMTAPDLAARAKALGMIDLLVAGCPCQSFSVAGLRAGLHDSRGNLTLRFAELCDELDPAWIVFENVPGILSDRTNAFGCLLAGLVGDTEPLVSWQDNGNWPDAGVAVGPRRAACWRILDAQYFGVPQRRRRVFVVARRADDGSGAAAVLLEPESLPRHSAPSREEGAGVARSVAACLNSGGNAGGFRTEPGEHLVALPDTASTVVSRIGKGGFTDPVNDNIIATTCGTLCSGHTARGHGRAGVNDQEVDKLVPVAVDYTNGLLGEVCGTIEAAQSKGNRGLGVMAYGFDPRQDPNSAAGLSEPLDAGTPGKAVCVQDVFGPAMAVRRLLPVECDRLQGFLPGYTAVEFRGNPAADGPRYRALGNAMCVNVMRWIGERIRAVTAAMEPDAERKRK